jgi:hypothetical protein
MNTTYTLLLRRCGVVICLAAMPVRAQTLIEEWGYRLSSRTPPAS